MDKNEMLKMQEQFKEEYKKIKDEFIAFCHSKVCNEWNIPGKSEEEKYKYYDYYLDGYYYSELEAQIPYDFFFNDGKARREFDVFRYKCGILNQMSNKISEIIDEDYDNHAEVEAEDVEHLIEESKKLIAEEKAFLEILEKDLVIYKSLEEE